MHGMHLVCRDQSLNASQWFMPERCVLLLLLPSFFLTRTACQMRRHTALENHLGLARLELEGKEKRHISPNKWYPALSLSLKWISSTDTFLLYITSMLHVFLDNMVLISKWMAGAGGTVGVWDPSTLSTNVQWLGNDMNSPLHFESHLFPIP